jgi:hypothetical protein
VKLKNIIFGLRRDLLLIPTDIFTKRNIEKLRLEATKSGLAYSGVHFEGNRTVDLFTVVKRFIPSSFLQIPFNLLIL